jgi:antitoxin HigA-1
MKMSDRARRRKPTSPGEILREEFLVPLGLSQKVLADHLGCDVKVVNRIVNGRCAVTAEMALRLGAAFRTSPDFWMNAQKAVDLYEAAGHVQSLPRPLLRAKLGSAATFLGLSRKKSAGNHRSKQPASRP